MSAALKAYRAEWEQSIVTSLVHGESDESRDWRAFVDTDSAWQRCRADPTYAKIAWRAQAAFDALPADLAARHVHPTVLRWVHRAKRVERAYGCSQQAPWEWADTPERFVVWLDRRPRVQWLMAGGHRSCLTDAHATAVRLASGTPTLRQPPPPPSAADQVHGLAYLVALRDWAAGLDAAREYLPHAAAYAQLGLPPASTKDQSKTMARIRRLARQALVCDRTEVRGRPAWQYERASWEAVVRLIRVVGGVDKLRSSSFVDAEPAAAEREQVVARIAAERVAKLARRHGR